MFWLNNLFIGLFDTHFMAKSHEWHMLRINQLRDTRDAKIRRAQGRKVVLGTFLSIMCALFLYHLSVWDYLFSLIDFVILVISVV